MKTETTYIANDGSRFATETECVHYENELSKSESQRIADSYAMERLIRSSKKPKTAYYAIIKNKDGDFVQFNGYKSKAFWTVESALYLSLINKIQGYYKNDEDHRKALEILIERGDVIIKSFTPEV